MMWMMYQIRLPTKKPLLVLKFKAAPKWYPNFDEVITSNGFKENIVDQCIYMKVSGRKYIFLVLYVDDILLITNDTDLLVKTKQLLFPC